MHEEKKGKACVLELQGRFDSSASPDVEKKILDVLASDSKEIILNFRGLEYISSAGIRVLVHCSKESEKNGGHLYLASVPKSIENVLYITGFLPYFQIYETPDQIMRKLDQP